MKSLFYCFLILLAWAGCAPKNEAKQPELARVQSPFEQENLKGVIDSNTYTELAPCQYSKDKKYVYRYADRAGGGFTHIVSGADATTFECIDSTFWWGIDKSHVFYRGELVKGLSPNRLKVLRAVPAYPMEAQELRIKHGKPDYVKNDKVVFYQNEQIIDAHVTSFRAVDSSEYDAIDKYRNYMQGKPVSKQ